MGYFGDPGADVAAFEEASYGGSVLPCFLVVARTAVDLVADSTIGKPAGNAIALQQRLEVLQVMLAGRIEARVAASLMAAGLGHSPHFYQWRRGCFYDGERFQIPLIASTGQALIVMQIADTLAERMVSPRRRTVPIPTHAKHLEGPRLIKGRFDAEQTTSLVIHLDAILADVMSHTHSQPAPLEAAGVRFSLVVFTVLASQECKDLLGVVGEHGMLHQLTVEPLPRSFIGKEEIGGILGLIDAPVMSQSLQFLRQQRIDQARVVFQEASPILAWEPVSDLLGQRGVLQVDKSIVDLGEATLLLAKLLGYQVVTIDIDLTREWCPGLESHMDKPPLAILEVVIRRGCR